MSEPHSTGRAERILLPLRDLLPGVEIIVIDRPAPSSISIKERLTVPNSYELHINGATRQYTKTRDTKEERMILKLKFDSLVIATGSVYKNPIHWTPHNYISGII